MDPTQESGMKHTTFCTFPGGREDACYWDGSSNGLEIKPCGFWHSEAMTLVTLASQEQKMDSFGVHGWRAFARNVSLLR